MSGASNLNLKNIQAIDSGTGSDKLSSNSISSFNFNGRLLETIEYQEVKDVIVGSILFLQDPATTSSPAFYKISKINQDPVTLLYNVSYFSSSNLYETFIEMSPLRNISATIVAGVATVTVPSTAGMFAGIALEKIDGTGSFGSTYPLIQSVDSSTQITLAINHSTSGTVVFNVMENRGKYIGTEKFYVQTQSVDTNNLGTEGWILSPSGQSIFTDIFARGRIEASSGLISGVLEVGTDNAENSYMSIGTNIFDGEPFEDIAKQHNGIFINGNNYLLTFPQSNDKTITSVVVTNPTLQRTRKTITLNVASHEFVLGTTSDGSVDTTEYFVLSGLTGALAELNGTQRVTALTTTSVTFYVYSETAFNPTYTSLSGSIQKYGNYDPYACSSLSVASTSDPITYNLVRLNTSGNVFEVEEAVDVDGLTGALTQLNRSFRIVTSNSSYIEVRDFDALITPNTYTQTGTFSSLNNDTKFRIGSTNNFMKYDSSLNSLTVSGTINASAGNFTSTVTIGKDSTTPGTLQVGTNGTSVIKIVGTGTATTSKIYSGVGTFKNANTGFYMDASGQFSIGNQLYFEDGTLFAPGIVTTSLTVGTSPNQMIMSPTAIPGGAGSPGLYMSKTGDFINATNGNFSLGAGGVTWDTATSKLTINGILSGYVTTDIVAVAASDRMAIGYFNAVSGGAPSGVGLKLDENNYWFVGNKFKLGSSTSNVVWNGTDLSVTGKIKATSGYIGGTTSGWEIAEGVIKSSILANTIILNAGIGTDNPFISIGNESDPSFYADSEGTLNIGSGTKSLTYNPTDGVTVQGRIKATSGFIGADETSGWQFGIDGSFQSGQGDDTVVLVSSSADFGGGSSTVKINRILIDDEWTQESQELLGSIYLTVDLANVNASYLSLDPEELSTTGTFTLGGNTITVANATGIIKGMTVTGAGIASNSTVTNISGTTITLTNNHTASGSGVTLTFIAQGFWEKYIGFSFTDISSGIETLLDGKRLIVQSVYDRSYFLEESQYEYLDVNEITQTYFSTSAIDEIYPSYIERSGTTLTFYTTEKLAGFTGYSSSLDLGVGQTVTLSADSVIPSVDSLNNTTAVISSIATTPTYDPVDEVNYYKIVMTTASSATLLRIDDFNSLSFYKPLSSTERTLVVYPEDLSLNVHSPSLEGQKSYTSVSTATTGAIGSTQVVVSSNSGIVARMSAIGTGIDPYSKVLGTPTTTTVNLSKANIAAVNSTVTFASASITFYDNFVSGSVGTYYMWAGDPDPISSSFSIVQNRSTKKIIVKADAGTAPVGSINMWATQNLPLGWILCNGAAITYAQYPELYVVLGGVSPYTATINVPDMRGRFPLGSSSGTMPAGRLVKALGSAPSNAFTHNHTTSLAHNHAHSIGINVHDHSDNFTISNHNHADNIEATAGATSSTTGLGATFLYSGVAGTYRYHTHNVSANVTSNNVANAGGQISGSIANNAAANEGGNITGSVTAQAATTTSTANQTEILPPYFPVHYIIYTGVI